MYITVTCLCSNPGFFTVMFKNSLFYFSEGPHARHSHIPAFISPSTISCTEPTRWQCCCFNRFYRCDRYYRMTSAGSFLMNAAADTARTRVQQSSCDLHSLNFCGMKKRYMGCSSTYKNDHALTQICSAFIPLIRDFLKARQKRIIIRLFPCQDRAKCQVVRSCQLTWWR